GTVVVAISNTFFDGLLTSIFRDLSPPTFNLAANGESTDLLRIEPAAFQGGCINSATLAAEGSGTKTSVQFAGGKILAPLAFSGKYNLLGNCMQFKGWAQTTMQLSF